MFGETISKWLSGAAVYIAPSFHALFGKSTVPGRKAARVNRQPGTLLPSSHHFNWRAHSLPRFGRPAWTYRGARRNAMKNPAMQNQKAVA